MTDYRSIEELTLYLNSNTNNNKCIKIRLTGVATTSKGNEKFNRT